ncbi:YraN family protein [Hamadaea tsunoensis]|uniref:YraN family protein n=1 Tax=Hamadaea tsunoensis TaxID=53368 RepID=UPI000416B752|nr:YraN family protein [Hamadaea tsunoensis]
MTRVRRALGAWGEHVAEAYLAGRGLSIIDRNWRCREGEIDLVAADGGTVVFCEVKTRRGSTFGTGLDAVAGRKAARLRRLAMLWLAAHARDEAAEIRFDVISVTPRPGNGPGIDHARGVF